MDFSRLKAHCSTARLGGTIAVLVLFMWMRPNACPAVESSPQVGPSANIERVVASTVGPPDETVFPAQINGDGDAVFGHISAQSRTVRGYRRFQHILQSTPGNHGLAPEKSHDADTSVK
ncbi:MAG: hypothetical protein RDU20_04255 [Desulfomonilaceae bacterium]|nr:hypothetical protein [Desulfomonilaceae bacterium]